MTDTRTAPGGTLALAPDPVLSRAGDGAMTVAGPAVRRPPPDKGAAGAVLRTAVELGVTHLDTSDFYGPVTVNELIREALYPYPADLRIVTKVGFRRGPGGSWDPAASRAELVAAVHDNLRHLGVDALDVVNLRIADDDRAPVADRLGVLAELHEQGLVRHLGLSNVSAEQVAQAREVAPIVCVQNMYNLVHRGDDALVDLCADAGIAYVPFFPLGGFSPLQAGGLDDVAARVGASAQQVALAWLLHRSPTILLIPGTSSVVHLRENLAAADVVLSDDERRELDAITAG